MVKHTQTIHRQMPMNCLSVFYHFVGLALKELRVTKIGTNFNAKTDISLSYLQHLLSEKYETK